MNARVAVLEIFKRPTLAASAPAANTPEAERITSTRFYWRLRAGNGEIIADGSESYTRRNDAMKAAERAKELMVDATVEVIA